MDTILDLFDWFGCWFVFDGDRFHEFVEERVINPAKE